MRSSAGRWVSGEDFFDRETEVAMLATKVRERNHVLLSGQRRMGKTSILQELGQRLENEGWIFFFVDVEGALCPEDAVAGMARAVHRVRPVALRFAASMTDFVTANFEEIGADDFSVKIRGGLGRRQLAAARGTVAERMCGAGQTGAAGHRRTAHLPQTHARPC